MIFWTESKAPVTPGRMFQNDAKRFVNAVAEIVEVLPDVSRECLPGFYSPNPIGGAFEFKKEAFRYALPAGFDSGIVGMIVVQQRAHWFPFSWLSAYRSAITHLPLATP
jgi:hypothetical protein